MPELRRPDAFLRAVRAAHRLGGARARAGAEILGVRILARRPRDEFDARHRLRAIYGAPISPELERVFREEFHVPVLIEGYGMTEIPGAANNPFDGEKRPNSMGRAAVHPDPAVKFAELRLVDDAGRDVTEGEVGEIWAKTPILMQGYYRDPAQTAASIEDGWFKTGDISEIKNQVD